MWQMFKDAFRRRYKDTHSNQYHFTKLQTARQARNESPQESPTVAVRSYMKVRRHSDPTCSQGKCGTYSCIVIYFGLHGVPGRQVRISNPQDIDEALKIAITVQEAERQKRFNESFYTRFDKSVRMCSRSPGRSRSENERQRQPADPRSERRTRTQRYKKTCSTGRS